jgi:hypothetical protein
MRTHRIRTAVALVVGITFSVAVTAGATTTALASTAGSHFGQPGTHHATELASGAHEQPFDFEVQGLPAGKSFEVQYRSGVSESAGGEADSSSGSIRVVHFLDNALLVVADPGAALDVFLTDWVAVNGPDFTGVATFPEGTTVTLSTYGNHQTVLKSGSTFSIPTDLKSGRS